MLPVSAGLAEEEAEHLAPLLRQALLLLEVAGLDVRHLDVVPVLVGRALEAVHERVAARAGRTVVLLAQALLAVPLLDDGLERLLGGRAHAQSLLHREVPFLR